MLISESKLKGMIAVGLILAMIPFIILAFRSTVEYKIPEFADQCENCSVVEIVGDDKPLGIYHVPPGIFANRLLKVAGIAKRFKNDFELKNGMKLVTHPASENIELVVAEIQNAAKISIGLKIDVNRASEKDLVLIKGIGPATAKKILELRQKLNGIKDIKQLMQIKGIKEKRIRQIEKYLYVKKK
jgi:DNA uptake protein ComE-like DNA-binding protein